MKNYGKWLLCLVSSVIIVSCRQQDQAADPVRENGTVDFKVHRFELKDVVLLDGPFKHANELNEKVLLNYEPDRFLATFRKESGLEPRAERYGGWESSSIAGHSLGHYLSACAIMWQSTGNPEFLRRVNYMVDELEQVQEAYGDGYIGAFPEGKKVFEEEIAKGIIEASAFDLNGIWAPWYTHHKVLGGLRDAYYYCGNEKALRLAVRFADWMETIVGHLPDETIQEMLICEYGGMNEVLAELYFLTRNEKYLSLSYVFHDKRILDSLAMGIDVLPGKHANTQIPKIIGLARRYELTGDRTDKETSLFFWRTVVHDHSYVTGSNALAEHFGPAGKLNDRLGANTGETCNVYNMLKLTDHLFRWDPSPELADYYERALFNHILASQHPENGRVTYHLSLEMGGFKYFQDPFAFTCCIGTGMENHAKYGENIYYHNESELFVSQYIASELNWSDKGLVIRQETGYPEEQGTRLIFQGREPVELNLLLRYPFWAEQGMEITVNGEKISVDSEPGSFVGIRRTWQQGDTVDVSIPFTLRLESMPDNGNRVALFYGPLTLAGDLGPVDDPDAWDLTYVPLMVNAGREAEQWTEPVKGRKNAFHTIEVGKPRNVQLIPFYAMNDRRYSVYWDLADGEMWKELKARHEAQVRKQQMLESRTVDYFQPGNIRHERSHLFEGPGSTAHRFRNKTYRVTLPNEWFAFNMKVRPDRQNALNIEYWGGGYDRESAFDIVVDGTRIASEDITDPVGDGFYTREYDIPLHMTRNKQEIRVEIRSQARRLAGPVYGVRTVID